MRQALIELGELTSEPDETATDTPMDREFVNDFRTIFQMYCGQSNSDLNRAMAHRHTNTWQRRWLR